MAAGSRRQEGRWKADDWTAKWRSRVASAFISELRGKFHATKEEDTWGKKGFNGGWAPTEVVDFRLAAMTPRKRADDADVDSHVQTQRRIDLKKYLSIVALISWYLAWSRDFLLDLVISYLILCYLTLSCDILLDFVISHLILWYLNPLLALSLDVFHSWCLNSYFDHIVRATPHFKLWNWKDKKCICVRQYLRHVHTCERKLYLYQRTCPYPNRTISRL